MRIPGAPRLFSAVALSLIVAGCGGNSFGTSPGAGGMAQAPMGHASKLMVAPGKAGQLVASHFHVNAKHQVFPAKKGKAGCIYLSDNASGTVSVYNSSTLVQTGSISGGGWGLADTPKNAFVGTPSDTINVYKQCGTTAVGTLTGTSGYSPYGMWASDDGSLISVAWPGDLLDEWGPGANGSEPYLGNSPESNMGSAYFVWYDALDKKSAKKGEKERILVNGWNVNFGNAQTDSCTRTLPNPALTCATLIANSGGFPGGVIAHHDASGKYRGGNVQNVVVNDQYGTLNGYACDITNLACALTGSFNYAAAPPQGSALDYTAIAFGTKCRDIWGANIFFIGSALNGDAQQNTPDTVGSGSALGSATTPIANAVPLGITVSKPCKDT
jgi:hypothetical protein